MQKVAIAWSIFLVALFFVSPAYPDGGEGSPALVASTAGEAAPATGAPAAPIKPYRTFVTIQRYNMDNNGEPSNPISNVRIEIKFPNGNKLQLPEGGQFWPIGNGQVQEINRTFELPWAFVQNDGFKFEIQLYRKGSKMLPCQFDVAQLSQFNRAYICRTDTSLQTNVAADNLDREGIQIRIFTDRNSSPREIPSDSLAVK